MKKLSVCMIVKNEESVLRRCLDCVAQFADELIVVDTGSIDRSVEIAREYTPHVYLHPWQNSFAEARNYLESNIEGGHDMSKSKEELNAPKEEVEAVNEKLAELTPEEIAQISGGIDPTTDRHGRWRQPGAEGYSGMGPRGI